MIAYDPTTSRRFTYMDRDTEEGLRPSPDSSFDPLAGLRWQALDPFAGIRLEKDDDDEEDDDDTDDTDDDEEDDNDAGGKSGGKRKKSSRDKDDDSEVDRLRRRMRAADRRADEAQRKLQEKEDAEKSELDQVKGKLKKAEEERDEALDDARELSVRLAVLTSPGAGEFHDPEDLVRFVDFDDLTDEDGELDKKAVKSALKKLAKDKPHLVRKSKSKDDDEDDEDQDDTDSDEDDDDEDRKPPKSGRSTNKRKKSKQQLSREKLQRKYPALRR